MHVTILLTIIAACAIIQQASGSGGRLMDPPSRSSAWRVGFPTPRNYDDNDVSCGGFLTLVTNSGKCGVCGDPWDGKRENEAGGKYGTGTIVRKYQSGQKISIKVDLTGNHLGWMEFRICPNNDVNKPVTHECLNRHVLQRADGTGARTQVNDRNTRTLSMAYTVPDGLTCAQCVLQWKFQTDDTWGVDKDTGKACIGCGYQEEFYGCADVAIGMEPQHTFTSKSPRAQTTQTAIPTTKSLAGKEGQRLACKGIHNWANDPDMDRWCTNNCAIGNCPIYGCECSNGTVAVTEKTTTTTTTTTSTTPPTTTPRTTSTTPTTTTTRMTTPTTTVTTTTTMKPTIASTTTIAKTPHQTVEMRTECKAINLWAGNSYLDRWCADACAHGNCPSQSCKCSMVQKVVTQTTTTSLPKTTESVEQHRNVCHAISLWKGIQVFDMWCTAECNKGNCPDDTCQCTDNTELSTTISTTTTAAAATTSTSSSTSSSTSFGKCVSNGIVGGQYWNDWCQTNCDKGSCDTGFCFCNL